MSTDDATPSSADVTAVDLGTLAITADIVSAYVTNNSLPASELPALIATIYTSLGKVGTPPAPAEEPRKDPAVPIRKSVTDDAIICLEDGKKFKSLKRHLMTAYNMTPDQYRTKWGLTRDYPMAAPGYSAVRSGLAKAAGLGASRKAAATEGKKASKSRTKKAA